MALDKDTLDSLKIDRGLDASRYQAVASRRWFKPLLGAALALLVAFLVFGRSQPLVVETTVAEPSSAAGAVLNASGYVVARRIATVASRTTGQLVDVTFEEGSVVKAGEVLARVDDAAARAAYRLSVAQRETTARELTEIQVRRDEAVRTRDRTLALLERKLVAQGAVDAAIAEVAALEARMAVARSTASVAVARVAQQQQQLDDLVIRAPFAGVIISKAAQPGEMVSPVSAGGGFTRTGIATVVDMSSREIEVDVNESFINRVHAGMPVEAVLDAYDTVTYRAHVIAIVPTADRQKATVRVRVGFDAVDARVLPDMGVKVRFLDSESAKVAAPLSWVPEKAMVKESVTGATAQHVWTVVDGKAVSVAVQVGPVRDQLVPILKGLEPGVTVIVSPPAGLADGRAVQAKVAD